MLKSHRKKQIFIKCLLCTWHYTTAIGNMNKERIHYLFSSSLQFSLNVQKIKMLKDFALHNWINLLPRPLPGSYSWAFTSSVLFLHVSCDIQIYFSTQHGGKPEVPYSFLCFIGIILFNSLTRIFILFYRCRNLRFWEVACPCHKASVKVSQDLSLALWAPLHFHSLQVHKLCVLQCLPLYFCNSTCL